VSVAKTASAVPERFVPTASRGQLVEAEHLVRYRWAMAFAQGRRVLDAGCGTAYGAAMMAAAGAEHVVGVDRAAAVLAEARGRLGDVVELVEGDVEQLPLEPRSFGLVVCLETLEHLDDAEAAIAELARVVSSDGLVIASSPNRDVYVPGNPHHTREFTPTELRAAFEHYFAHVELRRQVNFVASAVMPDDVAAAEGAEVRDVQLTKLVPVPPGQETYTVVMASHVPLPPDRSTTLTATGVTEVRRWLELYDEQQAVLRAQRARIGELEAREARFSRERAIALEAEQDRARALSAGHELAEVREENRVLRERLERSSEVVAAMQASPSWRLTAPLRAAKRLWAQR
jgi:SAM-dependent methyltransferase